MSQLPRALGQPSLAAEVSATRPDSAPLPARDALVTELCSLGRIAVSPIGTPEKMQSVLAGLAMDLAQLREQLRTEGHPQWWQLADAVDDVLDVYEAQFGPIPEAPTSADPSKR